MIKHFLRMKTRTEWWKLRNSLTGSWNNLALRYFLCLFCKYTRLYTCNWCIFYIFSQVLFQHTLWKHRFYDLMFSLYFATILSAENILHAVPKQVRYFWEEGFKSKLVECCTIINWWKPSICVDLWCSLHSVGATKCLRMVQGLPGSYQGERRDWACIWVRACIVLVSLL